MKSYFIRQGNTIRISPSDAIQVTGELPQGNYVVKFHPLSGYYLESSDNFSLPEKLYGNHKADAERVLNTFKARKHATGVLLCGEKGSGKTMLAKLISVLADSTGGIPTLIINEQFTGDAFNSFVSGIQQPCILLFDEFEKVYKPEEQQHILTLMDGIYEGNKLFLLTCNDKFKVDSHMRNRPGRLFYMLEYAGLDPEFITDYCQDRLDDKRFIGEVCTLSRLFTRFNFDMLQALVEEMNRYGETPSDALRMLNCKPDFSVDRPYDLVLKVDGKTINTSNLYDCNPWKGAPLDRGVHVGYYNSKDADGEDTEYTSVRFSVGDMVSLDQNSGTLLFRNPGGAEVQLKPQVIKGFDYRGVLASTF